MGVSILSVERTGGFEGVRHTRIVVNQIGRPDDGTDTDGYYNSEYFVPLRPQKDWQPALWLAIVVAALVQLV